MRGGIIVLGAILLIIGIFFIYIGLERIANENLVMTVLLIGLIFGFIGLIVSIIGFKHKIDKEDELKDKIPAKITEHISQDEALNTIKLRYAKGEITKKQYTKMKKDLEK